MTVCNMSIEAGAKAGLVAPDEKPLLILRGVNTHLKAKTGKTQSLTGKPFTPKKALPLTLSLSLKRLISRLRLRGVPTRVRLLA